MPNYRVTYTRVFEYMTEADTLESAGARAKNFAIGMGKNLGSPVKILSILPEGYIEPTTPSQNPTFYEKLVGGMRDKIDTLLE